MKITLLAIGSMGDVRPFVALAAGLHEAGFDVTVATHGEFAALVRAQALAFHELDGNPRDLLQSPEGREMMRSGTDVRKFAQRMRVVAGPLFRTLSDSCLRASEGADALVFSFLTAGVASQIARHGGQRTIAAYLQPLSPTGAFATLALPKLFLGGMLNRLSHRVVREIFWQVFRPLLADWSQQRFGSQPSRLNPFGPLEKRSLVLNAYSRMLVPRPYDWPANMHITGYWLLPEGRDWTPPAELEAFLAGGPPPVYVGFGSMPGENPADRTRQVIAALASHQQRGILLGGWGGLQARDLPDTMLHIDAAPHDWLFPRMHSVIHHGGSGTTHAGLYAGVPGLALPIFGDQAFWGQRLFGMGAGPRPLPQDKLTQAQLDQAIQALVQTERYARRAAELSQRMRSEGGVREAVELIRRFLSR